MKRKSTYAGVSLAVLAACLLTLPIANAETAAVETPPGGTAAPIGHETAVEACSAINPVQPVSLVNAVGDGSGIGFSLVWLNDKDGNLWMCDADANGNIYSYTLLSGDLLGGTGPELVGLQDIAFGDEDPQAVAAQVCEAYPEGGGKAVAVAADGLVNDPGFIVFIEDVAGSYHLCNATGDAAVWAFEPIGEPIDVIELQTS